MCLIYAAEAAWQAMSQDAADAMVSDYIALTRSLQGEGKFIGGNRLEVVASARTVRVRDGRVKATDGPFAETKEQLGGYYIIEAADINDAVEVAARLPGARIGSIEVRPIAPSHLTAEGS
jgi:hypothetical protein